MEVNGYFIIIFRTIHLYAAELEELLCSRLWKSKLKQHDLGTLDISICEIKKGKITIKAVKGDEHLGIYFNIMQIIFFVSGGQDFDGIIMNYAYQEYMKTSDYDIFCK